MDNDESLCARCAATKKTCCQDTQVFLTAGDVERIGNALGRDDFHCRVPAPDDYDIEGDPVWARAFDPQRRRRVLRHRDGDAGGDCLFLGPGGCLLASDVRPLICRLYPYEYDSSSIKGVTPHICPEPERFNVPLLLALLGMNRDQAEQWRRILYDEIEREFPC